MEFSKDSEQSLILSRLKPGQNLLAVSKLQSIEKIQNLYNQGQRHFAENYVQEALDKIESLKHLDIKWHLIGPLQKNKIKYLKTNFTYIHSVDSLSLAEKISEQAFLTHSVQKIFIQVNLSGESTKNGYSLTELRNDWVQLQDLRGLQIVGLMTMPPLENNSEKNRAFFKQLKYIGSELNLHEYSMGTSQDYQVALEEGATWIRLGTILFGERTLKKV